MARLSTDEDLSNGQLRGRTGPMAKVPWSDVPNIGFGTTPGSVSLETQDGGVGAASVFASGAGLPNGAGLGTVVRSTGVGIRAKKENAAARPPIDLIVDGRCMEAFRTTQPRINGVVAGTFNDFEASFEWPYALKLTDHTVIVRVDANLDGTTVSAAVVSGLLLPRSDGYRDVAPTPRKGRVATVTAPTVSNPSITTLTDSATSELRVFNTNASAFTVFLYEPGGAIHASFAVPASTTGSIGGTSGQTIPGIGVFTFAVPTNLANWKWKLDVSPTTALTAQARNV